MTDPPYHIYWDPGWAKSLKRLNITHEIFDRLAKGGTDFLLQTDPFEPDATFEIAETGHRYLHTRFQFPDLPAMLIAYRVDQSDRSVHIAGAESIWESDLFDPDEL